MTEQEKRVREYELALFNVKNNVQNKSSEAWEKLCDYVEIVAKEEREEFFPYKYLGNELYSQIHTLPNNISKLKKVKKIILYGSQLKRIPPEIGEMTSLENFNIYTSYNLHWIPYEITKCKNINDSLVSTRALYGNYKYRRPFPDLSNNPVRYDSENLKCSVCDCKLTYSETNQLWISLRVGTDVLPLLVNVCSKTCQDKLPKPTKNYVQYPHKGGEKLKQPITEDELWEIEWKRKKEEEQSKTKFNIRDFAPLTLFKKILKK